MVTGAAGFIGSALVRQLVGEGAREVVCVDKLTYAGNLDSLASVARSPRFRFYQLDIADRDAIRMLFERHRPCAVLHLAAESHVDRSIDAPGEFIQTNVNGTYALLEEARRYWQNLPEPDRWAFRFLHVSTDEVFGSLDDGGLFTEQSPHRPNSPYSASKAAADHLVRAWHHTYGLPVLITNCSNNYGPYQFPEKLIPLVILRARAGESLPVYGRGENERDWLYVDDHVRALTLVLARGRVGETYAVGGGAVLRNIDVVRAICSILQAALPESTTRFEELITFVQDRPGHDLRYAIDASKIRDELGWRPHETFESGLRRTLEWYLANGDWLDRVRTGAYRGERLGLGVDA